MNVHKQILEALSPHVSPLNARVLLTRACQRLDVDPQTVDKDDLPRLLPAMQVGIRLFLTEQDQRAAMLALRRLGDGGAQQPLEQRLAIERERDVKTIRTIARGMCERMGVSSFAVQRLVTLVSELARNIVNYTDGGEITLTPLVDQYPCCFRVVAQDSGPGISNLDEILGGRYRSRTGLGVGLRGVRKLAKQFNVETSPAGTRIDAEIGL